MFLLYQDPLKGSWNKKSLCFVFIDLSIPAVIQGFLSCLLLDCGVFLIGACLSVIFWRMLMTFSMLSLTSELTKFTKLI